MRGGAPLRLRLALSSALGSGLLLAAGQAAAQAVPSVADIVTATGSTGAAVTIGETAVAGGVDFQLPDNRQIIDWAQFGVPSGTTVTFRDARATGAGLDAVAVLNRVVDTGGGVPRTEINGTLASDPNVSVYLVNPSGILFGGGAVVNVGGLIASTQDITDAAFRAGTLRFQGDTVAAAAGPPPVAASPGIVVSPGARLSANGVSLLGTGGDLGNLVLIGASLSMPAPAAGETPASLSAARDVALVAAGDVEVQTTLGGPLSLTIRAGTRVDGAFKVNGTIAGQNVTMALATRGALIDALLGVGGTVETTAPATGAIVTPRGVVLVADRAAGGVTFDTAGGAIGTAGGVATTGTVDASKAGVTLAAGTGGVRTGARVVGRGVTIDTAGTATLASLIQTAGGAGITVDAGTIGVSGTVDASGDARLTAVGAFNSGGSITGVDVTITAGLAATIGGAVTARGDYVASGTSVTLGTTGATVVQTAARSIDLTATAGDIVSRGTLSLTANDRAAGRAAGFDGSIYLDAVNGGIGLASASLSAASHSVRIRKATASTINIGTVDAVALNRLPNATRAVDVGTVANFDTAVTLGTATLSAMTLTVAGAIDIDALDTAGAATLATSAGGAIRLGKLTTGATSAVTAAGSAAIRRDVSATGTLTVRGADVTLGTAGTPFTQSATDGLTVTATAGRIVGLAGLRLQSGAGGTLTLETNGTSAGATDGDIDFALGSTLAGGPARQSDVLIRTRGATNSVRLGDVSAARLLGADGGAAPVIGLSRSTALRVGSVDLTGAVSLEGTTIDATSLAGSSVTLASSDTITTGAVTGRSGVVTITGAGDLSATGAAIAAQGGTSDLTIDRGGAVSVGSLAAGQDIRIGQARAPSTLRVGGTTGAGRDLWVDTGDLQSYGGLVTARDATLSAGAALTLTGGLTATRTAILVASGIDGGTVRAQGAAAPDVLSLEARTGDIALAAILGSGTTEIEAGGTIRTARAEAGAGRNLTIVDAAAVEGLSAGARADLAAGGNISTTVAGEMRLGTVDAGGTAGLTAGSLNADAVNATTATLTATGGDIAVGRVIASGAATFDATGRVGADDARAGAAADLTVVRATAIDGFVAGTRGGFRAGRDLKLTTVGEAFLDTATAGRDATIDGGSINLTTLVADATARLVTRSGTLLAASATGAGGITFASADRLGVDNGIAGPGSDLVVSQATQIGGVAAGTRGNFSSGQDVTLTTGGEARLGTVAAGRTATISATDIDATTITAGTTGIVDLTATRDITVETLSGNSGVRLDAIRRVGVTAATAGAGADIVVTRASAIGGAAAGSRGGFSAGGDVTLTTGGSARLAMVSAGGTATVTAADVDAASVGSGAGGIVDITATTDGIVADTINGVGGVRLDAAGRVGVTAATAGSDADIFVTRASAIGGAAAGSRGGFSAGRDVTLTTSGSARLAVVSAGGTATVRAADVDAASVGSGAGGIVDITATTDGIVADTINGVGGVRLDAAGRVGVTAATAGSDADIFVTRASAIGGAAAGSRGGFSAGRDVTLTTSGSARLAVVSAGGTATVRAADVDAASVGSGAGGIVDITATTDGIIADAIDGVGGVRLDAIGRVGVTAATAGAGADIVVVRGSAIGGAAAGSRGGFSAGRDVTLNTGGSAMLAVVSAGGTATVTAADVDAASVGSGAGGIVDITATTHGIVADTIDGVGGVRLDAAGRVGVTAATAGSGADIVVTRASAIGGAAAGSRGGFSAGRDVTLTSSGETLVGTSGAGRTLTIDSRSIDVTAAGAGAALGPADITLTATNGVVVGDLTASGSVIVSSGAEAAAIDGNVSAGAAYRVSGASVALARAIAAEQQAGGAIRIRATTGIVSGGAGLVLRSDLAGSGAALVVDAASGVAVAPGSLLAGGIGSTAAVGIRVDAGDIALGRVTASSLGGATPAGDVTAQLIAPAALTLGGAVTVTNAFDAIAATGLSATAITVADGALTLATGGAADIAATGRLEASGALLLSAGRALTFGDAVSTGASATALSAQANAGGALSGNRLEAGTIARAESGSGPLRLTGITGQSATATGADVGIGTATASAGRLTLTATAGPLSIASAFGRDGIRLSTPGRLGVDATSSGAAGDVAIVRAGEIGGTVSGAAGNLAAGRDLTVSADGSVLLGTIAAARDAMLVSDTIDATTATAGRALTITTTGGSLTVATMTAGGALTLDASGRLGVGSATAGAGADFSILRAAGIGGATGGTRASLTAGRDVLVAATGDARLAAVSAARNATIRSGAIDLVTLLAGGVGDLTAEAGALLIGTATGTGGLILSASGRLGIDAGSAGANADLVVTQADGIGGTASGSRADLSAGRNVLVAARGLVRLGSVAGGRAVSVTADGIDVGTISAGSPGLPDGLALTAAAGDLLAGTASATGEIRLSAAGRVGVGTATAGGDVAIVRAATVGGVAAGERAAVSAARDLAITASGEARLATASAGGDATIAAGAIDASAVTAAGTANLTATAGDLIVVDAAGGAGLTLAAAGRIGVDRAVASGGDLVVRQAVSVDGTAAGSRAGLVAGGDISIVADGPVSLADAVAGRRIGITATAIDATTLTATGGDIAVVGSGTLTVADATSGRALSLTGGSIALGTGRAGADARVRAEGGDLTIGDLEAAGLVEVRAGGAGTIGRAESSGGSLSVTTGRALRAAALRAAGAGRAEAATATIGEATAGGALTLLATQGDLVAETASGGGGATLRATGAVRTNRATAGGADADLAIDAASIGGVPPSARAGLSAGRDVTLTTSGATVLGPVAAGRAAALTAGAIDLTALSAGGATLTATGAATIGEARTSGAMAIDAGAALDATRLTAGGALTASGATLTLGTAEAASLALTARAGAATLTEASATAGDAALVARGGGITLSTLAVARGAISIDGGGFVDIGRVTGAGALTVRGAGLAIGAATSSAGAAALTSDGDAAIGTLSAARGITIAAPGLLGIDEAGTDGPLRLTGGRFRLGALTVGEDASLIAQGDIALTSLIARNGAIGIETAGRLTATTLRSAAALGATAAALDLASVDAGGVATLAAGTGDAALGRIAAGGVTLTAGGVATIGGAVTATGGYAVRAASIRLGTADAAVAQTAGGAVSLVATAGAISGLGTLSLTGGGVSLTAAGAGGAVAFAAGATITGRGGDVTAEAGGAIAMGNVAAAGRAVTLTAADLTLAGAIAAERVTLVNRAPVNPMLLGETPAGGADFAVTGARFDLSSAELARIAAPQLIVDAQSGAVRTGALAIAAGSGSASLHIRTSGRMDVLGRFVASGSPAGRLIVLGGGAAETARARSIAVVATAGEGGRLLLDGATLDLRGDAIAVGQSPAFLADLALGGTSPAPAEIASRYVSQPNSSLYNATLGNPLGLYSDPVLVSAGRMVVRYADFALFQNSGPPGTSTGVVLGAEGGGLALELAPAGGSNAFAIFGTVNGIGGTATSLLGGNVIAVGDGTTRAASRANGCLIGSAGGGCLAASLVQPTLNIFDSSRGEVFRTADDLTLPFDPLVSTSNEALFSDIASLSQIVEDPACPPGDETCRRRSPAQ
ncbi:MAG: filamentous hemagglutinin N-terminal domain-containing protein [Sphingomonas fennica]